MTESSKKTKKAKPRRRRTKEESEDTIVCEAIRLFARHGFYGTSFQAIADACGTRQTTVLYHFPSRDALLRAVLTQILKNNHAIVSKATSDEDKPGHALLKHFKANLSWAVSYPHEAEVILLLYYFAASDRVFSKLYEEVLEGARTRIRAHLDRAIALGLIARATDTQRWARTLHDALLGGIVNFLSVRKFKKPELPTDDWKALIDHFFRTHSC